MAIKFNTNKQRKQPKMTINAIQHQDRKKTKNKQSVVAIIE